MTLDKLKAILFVIAIFAALIFFVLHPLKFIAAILLVVMCLTIYAIITS